MTKLSHQISHSDVDNPPKAKREFVQPGHMFDRGACVAAVPVRRPTFVRSEAAMSLVSSERATGIVRLGPATARRRFGGNGQPRPPGGRPASSSPRGRATSPPSRARMSVVGTDNALPAKQFLKALCAFETRPNVSGSLGVQLSNHSGHVASSSRLRSPWCSGMRARLGREGQVRLLTGTLRATAFAPVAARA